MQNSIALFTFSVSNRQHPFWVNLVQKIKLATLTLIWVGSLEVRFEVGGGGGGKISPSPFSLC